MHSNTEGLLAQAISLLTLPIAVWWLLSIVVSLVAEARGRRGHLLRSLGNLALPGSPTVARALLASGLIGLPACTAPSTISPPRLAWEADVPTTTSTTTTSRTTTSTTTTSRTGSTRSSPPAPAEPTAPDRTAEAVPQPPTREPFSRHRVEPGDHLWSISTRALVSYLGRPPSNAEVAAYWRRVIDENRATLMSGDPDLLHPGEEVILPKF